jgi:phage-related minor tail protein
MAEKVIGFKIQIEGLAGTIETATQLKRQIAELNSELKKTADVDEIKKLEKKLVDLKAAQSLVNDVTREQIKLRKEEIAGIDKSEGAYRRLSKELNDQRKRYKDLAAAEQASSQEARDLIVSIGALDKKLKGIDANVGQFQRNVGGYTEALSNFFPKLSGTLGQVTGAIGGIQNGFANLSKSSSALTTGLGGIGIALTAFQAISEIVGSLIEAARATKELSAQVTNFTQITGDELEAVVATSQAIAVTYGKNVDDIVVAANSASKALGISFAQALDVVEIGFRKGADAQGQFLDGLKEYSVQFRDAGLSAEDFLRVSIASANEGIFSDKGLDAVKEFGLKIQEQTKGSKDALTNAFGEEFTSQLFENINNGSITSGQAFGLVTDKITETGIAGSQLQTVIADVFGGPGEDIGKDFLLTLGDVLQSTDDVTLSTNLYQKQQEELFKVNEQLKISEVAYNTTLATTGVEFEIATAKGKIFLNSVLSNILGYFEQVPNRLNAYKKAFAEFTKPEGSILSFFKVFNQQIKDGNKEINLINKEALIEQEKNAKAQAAAALNTQGGLEQKLSDLRKQRKTLLFGSPEYKKLGEEIKGIEGELNKFKPEVPARNLGGKLGKEIGRETVKEFTEGSIAALENERGKLQSAFSNAVVGSGTQKELAVKLNAINVQIKDAVEQQNQILADASRGNLLKNLQQAEQLTTLPLTTTPLKSINKVEIAKKEGEDLKKVQEDIIKSSDDANKKRIENEKQAQKDLYENRQKNIELAGQSALALTDLFSTLQSAKFKKDEEALNKQIQLTESNIATLEAKADKATGLRKKKIEKELANERILLEAKNKQQEELQLKAAKQEKKIAIVQSIIQGALAVQRALNSFPFPPLSTPQAIAAGVFSAIQTATIIAQPLAEGGVVTGQRVNQKQNIPTRSNGDNVLAYVKRGEVVLNQRQQSLLGGSPTFRRIGIKGFAEGGMVPPISAPIQGMSIDSGMSGYLKAIEAKTDAINNRIDRLQAYVVSDDIARDLAEGNKLKVKATL